jgi:acyl transferase domain-containing protein/thioesterase domain-containing protein/aryl carrier-like protein
MSGTDYAAPAFAVIGLSGRFPGAADTATLWANLRAGVESITFFSDEQLIAAGESPERLSDPNYVKACGRLADIDKFDAGFFGMSPRDAAVFDPQHRVFLECAWEAFEDAGYVAERFDGPVGVFATSGGAEYLMHNLLPNRQVMESVGAWLVRHTGNDPNFLATRASYELDLNGPSMSVQTACSSSLVAVHLACQSLMNAECDMALAGGSTIYPEQNRGYLYKEGEILSPDGHCRPFDANSAGTVMASAVGCVIIRRLEDALRDGDRILAVIRGSAVNNDGSQKVGYLAPSVTGQARVVTEALAVAGVNPEDVSYVEAHGTGTLIGDPIEITALTQAFRSVTDKKQFCAIGSLKSNLGHTGEASGICGFIKTLLALQHHEIPPSLHYDSPNPQADLPNSPFFVNTELRDWIVPTGKRRIAGVTSLGAGGTNVHVIVEEAPTSPRAAVARSRQLLVLSARTASALEIATQNLAAHLRAHPELDLADEAFTLLAGRKQFAHRRVVVVKDASDAVEALEGPDRKRLLTVQGEPGQAPSVFFMFPGGGAQYARMGADLYQHEPVYRTAFDEAVSHLEPALRAELAAIALATPAESDAASARLEAPSRALPALLATEYAIARLLASWGIAPAAMIGHSAGEYAAACLAGVITLREAMTLVALRGRLFETLSPGGMLSVSLPVQEAQEFIGTELSFAAINAPALCVLSGPLLAIDAVEDELRARDVECTRVHINVAAHSAMVDPILNEFERFCRTIAFKRPQIPFISNVTGTWISDAEATDPGYWARHLRSTVQFADGVQKLLESSEGVFCEIGPGRTLSSLVRMQPEKVVAVTPTLRHPREEDSDVAFLLGALGRLWLSGVPLDEARFFEGEQRRRVPLPTYPFERQRYWIDPDPVATSHPQSMLLRKNSDIGEWFYAASWARSAPPAPIAAGKRHTWLVFTDQSTVANATVGRLRDAGYLVVEVVPAKQFASLGNLGYGVDPAARADFDALAQKLRERGEVPERVLHLWALTPRARRTGLTWGRGWDALQAYPNGLALHYFSLLFFAQAFAADVEALRLVCVSSHLQSVPGDTETHPEKAALLGACKVIPREYPHVSSISIDVALPTNARDQAQLVERLLSELEGDSADSEVALRGRDRWVRRFDRVRLGSVADRPWLRKDGVYLITGGLGGIGLRVAEHLARAGDVKLVLLGRTPLPPEERFAEWLASHPADDPTSHRINALQEIHALGAEVMTVAADVTDLQAMRAALASVRARFGAVHGVFHAAGVLNDELIALRSPTPGSAVLDAKIKGALVLDRLLANEPLDVFVLFSSVSSILGLPGQADYTAANAFLDAFAQARAQRGPGRTVSIDWNAWRDVGMLAGEPTRPSHPMLEAIVSDDAGSTLFRTAFRRSDIWVLGEHVVRGGDALIPGTAFLEVARAALEQRYEPRAVELRDVVFLAPFAVGADGERALHVRVARRGAGEFTCYAESEQQPLVVGKIGYIDPTAAPRADLAAIRERCTVRGEVDNRQLVQHFMDFGPRWGSVQRIDLGLHEALISLELPDAVASDVDSYRLHPALLDLATGGAQALIPGFNPLTTFNVPFSYHRVVSRRALPSRVFSHVRLRDRGPKDSVVFDATLYDSNGEEVASIDGFTMRKAAPGFAVATAHADPRTQTGRHPGPRPETATQTAIREGMTSAEGVEALDRVLAVDFAPQVVVCTVPLHAWLDRLAEEAHGPVSAASEPGADTAGPVFARPSVAAAFAPPRTAIERELAALWSRLLGVAEVGVHDDFFELGGHSLIAVRLLARIRKSMGVDLALETLFRAPTIALCAQLIVDELGGDVAVEPALVPPLNIATPVSAVAMEDAAMPSPVSGGPSGRARGAWSALVPIQVKGSKPALFCVHGAGGNVLNLRDLSRRLGDDQPFYGLQAQGVDGKLPPMRRVEDMAVLYLEAVRQVQPHGPYLLAGYSGGGVVAYEMAQRLRADGEDVSFLGFLDTFCPVQPDRPGASSLFDEMPARARARLAGDLVVRGLGWRPSWWPGFVFGWKRARIRWHTRHSEPIPHNLREFALYDAFLEAHEHYKPSPYGGPVTLWRAQEMDPKMTWIRADLGWDAFVAGGVEVHTIQGNHQSLILEPNVHLLVAELKDALDRAVRTSVTLAA